MKLGQTSETLLLAQTVYLQLYCGTEEITSSRGNMNLLTDVIYVGHLRICSNKCILLLKPLQSKQTHQVVGVWGLSSESFWMNTVLENYTNL